MATPIRREPRLGYGAANARAQPPSRDLERNRRSPTGCKKLPPRAQNIQPSCDLAALWRSRCNIVSSSADYCAELVPKGARLSHLQRAAMRVRVFVTA